MANYKRVISYMYAYRNQLKGNNVGFARIETRGNECKITLHIRVVNMKDQEVGGYIYCWYNGELHAVYLGDIHISNGVGELIVKTDVDNVMNSRYRFTEMGGILLYVSDAQYIATEWDGKAVLFDALKIDTVKPENDISQPMDRVAAAETAKQEVIENKVEKEVEIEAAVAVAVPVSEEKVEEEKVEEELEVTDTENELDEMIESEVAKEEEEEKAEQTAGNSEERPVPRAPVQKEENMPEEEKPEQSSNLSSQEAQGTFPLSREKMEHLDKEAQELFGTMLLDTLFPPEKSAENQKEAKREQGFDPLSEEPEEMEPVIEESKEEAPSQIQEQSVEEEPEETVQASGSLTVNPKTAIECFTAFRSCESAEEYDEIQEEIDTMQQEIKYLEHISEEWKIKEARLLEMQREKAELEKEEKKHEIEERIRSEYNIEGIQSELEAAEVKRALTERIFNKYPSIEPFEDASVESCVRIEPQDLGIFPMENWILANNSFLLHGYYSYRHLIFLMEKQDGREHYLLGVPGVNHSRERFMANMFGFNTFKNLSSKQDESGEFGYWCHEITM